MSHSTWTQGNLGDSWLLMVGSQFDNLTFDPSSSHNLCYKCPNASWKPILNIYVPRNFQWYKECFNIMGFVFYDRSLKIWESNSQSEGSFGNVRVHSFTLSYTPGSMRCDSQISLLAHTLVSPCLRHEPKVRVVTIIMCFIPHIW
jgi:hypothetical protein